MSNPETDGPNSRFGDWFTVDRQGPILGGVVLLLALWLGRVIEPFALGIPAYAFYFVLSEPAKRLGLIGIEGSLGLFWVGAVIWLYLLCSVLLYAVLAIRSRTRD